MYGFDDVIPATFQVVNFIGWKPDPSQPKPAARGSATVSLKDLDNVSKMESQLDKMQQEAQHMPEMEKPLAQLAESIEKLRKKTMDDANSDDANEDGDNDDRYK